ncbi:kelch domain-containing protein 7A [Suncus etruscus]|uniref:kelch domain-containing protein 7A n=1 Tax=Suncus etruscus TaxID=109475 RepID=UPI00211090F6|nr:kelch domain-containing protein 7A [Suncus etruscus]
MPLSTDKVVLSAAALLLATAAYRLYKSRPARTSLEGGHSQLQAEEKAEGVGQSATQGSTPGTSFWGLRRRKGSEGAEASLSSSRKDSGGTRVLEKGASPRDEKPKTRDVGEQLSGYCPDSGLTPPCCSAQEAEAGAEVGGKPKLPHHPHLASEPESSPTSLQEAGSSDVDVGSAPEPEGNTPEHVLGAGEYVPPQQPSLTPPEDLGVMNRVFFGATEICREEMGAFQTASSLALYRQERDTNTSYSFSSVAQARMEENFLQEKVEDSQTRLKGKVYDYYVESTSLATSGLALKTGSLAKVPKSVPDPLGTEAAKEDQANTTGGGAPVVACSPRSTGRKDSLLQIVENPELQLQLDGFRAPAASSPDLPAMSGSPGSPASLESSAASSMEEPRIQQVARSNFFHLPLTTGPTPEVHLDLGNCWEVLTLAKRQNLEALKEAAYKVMSDNYLQVLRSPDIYSHLSDPERDLILQRRFLGHQRLVVADVCPQEVSGCLCYYDDEQDAWHPLARLPPEAVSQGCAICSLFNYLFMVSGCQGSGKQPSKRVLCYNPLTGIWSEVSPLNQARPHCRLVALDGCLYAIGGESLNTVERYDPSLDRWTLVAPLPSDTFARAHTATTSSEEIFVTGGSLRYMLLRFSVREQRWQAGPTAGGKDHTAEMVAVNGFLYRFDLNRSLGISVHRCSTSARLWYECDTNRTPYPDAFQCAVVGTFIYCVGHRRTLCFLADPISPRFVPKELRSFPSPKGTLLPTVLTLPGPSMSQTRV